LAYGNDGFPPHMFDLLAELEEKSFWFKARNEILIHLFQKYLGTGKDKKVLEIGCGNGYVLRGLQSLGYQLIGSEIYLDGLKNVQKRLQQVELIQLDALNMPFSNELNAIGAFDVIEHIDNDVRVMQQVYQALKPGGYFFITVPQYQFMWSYLDDYARHKRRYTQKELKKKLEDTGFQIRYSSSFVTMLFPFVLLSRLLKKNKPIEKVTVQDVIQEFQIPEWMNNLFYKCMKADVWCIRNNFSLPFGNSIVVVAQK
ncbi:MAG: methyltransferase domain-containing protein, partial [Bacteroidia bacterium]|nr:methyltransferase domain-containing protein [Bacteroidia bacterium]